MNLKDEEKNKIYFPFNSIGITEGLHKKILSVKKKGVIVFMKMFEIFMMIKGAVDTLLIILSFIILLIDKINNKK